MQKSNQELIQEISNKIADLKKEMEYFKNCRISECEFEKGEKVKVYRTGDYFKEEKEPIYEGNGFIDGIKVDDNGDLFFIIKKEKKDGTKSSFSYSEWYNYKIEKL